MGCGYSYRRKQVYLKQTTQAESVYSLDQKNHRSSTSMASSHSSSSSAAAEKSTYDVFLSFRGEDTRNNFVDHLSAALIQRGIHTFKDDENLRIGKPISSELFKAIEESRFAVVVFSPNYAHSSWCLDEIAKIMECHHRRGLRVLPVFYHVDPSDVRRQNGRFATHFHRHQEEFGDIKVKKWREALEAAATLSGCHVLDTVNRGESECINKIVREILGDIKPHVMEKLIGIESRVQTLNSLVDTEAMEEVRMVGIWGMGGIGKTTIAQALFRRIAYKFEGSSFVKEVRENSSNEDGICALQEKILKDTLMTTMIRIRDLDNGIDMIRRRLSNKKVLLVLDDVDNVKQLEALAATHEWFGPGSRIIITTRNEHLLSDVHVKYKPDLLLMDQAIELFSRYAFQNSSPPEGYKVLSHRAVSYTGYLPLALKVLGSYFHGRQLSVWESALKRLNKEPNTEIYGTLKLSFDGLEVSEKKIFLDIACFFKGKDKEHVTRILDSFGFDPVIGISVLIEKSLVTVLRKRLDMHDLIQEMGRKIVRESFANSRLWHLEEIHDLIMRTRKLKAIEAIVLRDQADVADDYDEKLEFNAKVFRSMTNLRLLDIDPKFPYSEPTFLPDQLRWLCWYKYAFPSLPKTHMRKLVGLEMNHSFVDHLWVGRKILPNLKFIDLSESQNLTSVPDVSGAPNLERLILCDCWRLVEVHESVGFHKKLVYLDLRGCRRLKCLPLRIQMESLETLILSDCVSLEKFPEISPFMENLSSLYLDYCRRIEELPLSFRFLSGLSFLNLTRCKNLKNLPKSISELKNLKGLHLHNCKKLHKLPEGMENMQQLEELRLGFSVYTTDVPESIFRIHTLTCLRSLRKLDLSWRQFEEDDFPKNLHAFSSLEELHLTGNSKLIRLPASISHLSHLRLLGLSNCHRLENLCELPSSIQILKAKGCSSLEKIGNLSKEYEWLYKIWLSDCHKLLEDQENERYLDNMLQQSFIRKCAAVNHRMSVTVPGSKIPSWFSEQRQGSIIALKLPPKWHNQIMGFTVCGVFYGSWTNDYPKIIFKILNDETLFAKPRDDFFIEPVADNTWNVWIAYIPIGFFQQLYHGLHPEDWSHVEGNLVMAITRLYGDESVNCGAQIVYKDDLEVIQETQTCVSDYGNLVQIDYDDHHEEICHDAMASANTYVYEEKFDDNNLNLKPPKSQTSKRRNVYDRSPEVVNYAM